MAPSVLVDKRLQEELAQLKSAGCKCGLLIGQWTGSQYRVAAMCRTPLPPDGGDVGPAWLAKHARQLSCLLPGGLHVLGIFIMGGSEELRSREAELRAALTAIYRALEKLESTTVGEPLLTAVDASGRVACRTIEMPAGTSRPADWRYQAIWWHCVETELEVALTTTTSTEDTLQQQLTNCLQPWFAALARSRCLVDGKFTDADAILCSEKASRSLSMDLLTDTAAEMELVSGQSALVHVTGGALVRLDGRLHCRARLHPKATVGDALAALCEDARRSMLTRCRMHCDALVEEDSDEAGPSALVLHEPPRRVLAPLSGGALFVSDYLFPGDSAADSLPTFTDLFGLQLPVEQVVDTVETPRDDRSESASEVGALDDLRELQSSSPSWLGWRQVVGAGVAMAVALVTAWVTLSAQQSHPKAESTEQHRP